LIIRNGFTWGSPEQSFFFYDKRFAGFMKQSFRPVYANPEAYSRRAA
jgi:hypothetical protein